jgi:hypothetical protein
MASHVREQITVAVVSAVTGLTTTGSRVWRDRDTEERPLQDDEAPGLTIEDDGEPAETISITGGMLERRMALKIAGHVKAASYSTALNQILKEVEIALSATLLSGKTYAQLTEVSAREVSEAGDLPTVRQEFRFEFVYYTLPAAPDVAL